MTTLHLFISCPRGLEYLLETEVKEIGLTVTRVSPQGVYGECTLAIAYQLCLWSRIANRIQLILFTGTVSTQEELYQLCHDFSWETVFLPHKTFTIEFHGTTPNIRNTMFGAQVVKDGIVDYFRKQCGQRPSIGREQVDIRLHAYLKHNTLTVSFDLTGYSLHQRGYRTQTGSAPIKENVAAALLLRSKWPALVKEGYDLYDPCCGSGTIVIEAAMIAADMAPGLLRNDASLHHWVAHQPTLWDDIRSEALQRVKPVTARLQGADLQKKSISLAQENAQNAGVLNLVSFIAAPMDTARPQSSKGLLITNPPYGERLEDVDTLVPLYQSIGHTLHTYYQGWQAAILTNQPVLARAIGLRSHQQATFYNGALECKLYFFNIDEQNQLKQPITSASNDTELSPQAQMFANRLQKNLIHLKKWAERNQISCYRVYDADLPEYAFAIDLYNDHVVLQEYAPPATIPDAVAEKRRIDVIKSTPSVLGISPQHMAIKTRKQQKGSLQYEKIEHSRHGLVVFEGRAKLKVNLYDYLDTGLFLDHRPLRLKFAALPSGTRFLNCFCYTASASVHAALAGAKTTNIDLSNTYLNWARDNFDLNQLDLNQHQFIATDCIEWLQTTTVSFDVIFLDPPSFSNSKKMSTTLDIQRDHEPLIQSTMRLLKPHGTLYFSTNLRSFKLSPAIQTQLQVEDITIKTIDLDFKRNPRVHRCFKIQKPTD